MECSLCHVALDTDAWFCRKCGKRTRQIDAQAGSSVERLLNWDHSSSLRGIDVSGCEFPHGVDLAGADLTGASFEGATLPHANLQRANLTDANLRGVDFTFANLSGAHLHDANLSYTTVVEGDLRGIEAASANMQGILCDRANLDTARLSGTSMVKAACFEASFRDTYLNMVDFASADLRRTSFQNAHLMQSSLVHALLDEASLNGAYMQSADLRSTFLTHADLTEAFLVKANFEGAFLRFANLERANACEAIFRFAEGLSFDQLRTVYSLEGAILPDGTRLSGRYSLTERPGDKWHGELVAWDRNQVH
jgi:uncharacterized protein YjbI with pentapeptide repeats